MNRAEQRRRHQIVDRYFNANSDNLFRWAEEHNLKPRNDDDIPFIKLEIIGRVLAAKAIKYISGYTCADIRQMPIDSNYDMETPAGTHIEVKFKFNDGDEYPTDDITLHKAELNEGLKYTGETHTVIPCYDGVVRCYSMFGPSKEGQWTKNRKTVVESDSTTEKKLIYERKDLLWETRITMPNFEGDDDEQRDT